MNPQVALMLYTHKCPIFFNKDYSYDIAPEIEVAEVVEVVEIVEVLRSEEIQQVTEIQQGEEIVVATAQTDPIIDKIVGPTSESEDKEEPTHGDGGDHSGEEIIEKFLISGEYKIVPKDDAPEFIVDENYAVAPRPTGGAVKQSPKGQANTGFIPDDDDEFLTEELADIYINQELFQQGKEIYSRLKLIYPEKSVYFVKILGDIELLIEKTNKKIN